MIETLRGSPRSTPTSKRIPSLDGLRAISILLVIFGHLQQYHGPQFLSLIATWSRLGVSIFFVLSGFLITSLLIGEADAAGILHLGNFYARRALRIIPPYYFYIAFVVILRCFNIVSTSSSDVFRAVAFIVDYQPTNWVFEHAWSLSVEEQFYLAWPIMIIFAKRQYLRWIAVSVICVEPLLRVVVALRGHQVNIHFFHLQADTLMCGCLMALIWQDSWVKPFLKKVTPFVWMIPIYLLIISPICLSYFHGSYLLTAGISMEALLISILMLWLVENHHLVIGKALNSRFISHIGVTSYSLYLWQHIFLHEKNTSAFSKFPLNLILIVLCAEFSYRFIERPVLTLRKRFETSEAAVKPRDPSREKMSSRHTVA